MSTSYQSLLTEVTQIAARYSFEELLEGYTPSLINILMRNHIDKVKQAQDYNAALSLITSALSAHMGLAVDIADFITSDADRKRLYQLFADWRVLLLSEVMHSNPSS